MGLAGDAGRMGYEASCNPCVGVHRDGYRAGSAGLRRSFMASVAQSMEERELESRRKRNNRRAKGGRGGRRGRNAGRCGRRLD